MNNTPSNTLTVLAKLLLAAAILFITSQLTRAQTTTWSGLGADQFWSTPANWTTSGGSTPPGPSDNVVFPNGVFATSPDGYDNIVGASTSVGSLSYLNVSPNTHTTHINDGQTLTVNGPFSEGVASSTTVVTMSGSGNFIVNNISGAFSVGGLGGSTETVTLTLADGTNTINVDTLSLGESASNNGRTCTMNLGAGPAIINADNINIGTGKASGTLRWNDPSFTNGLVIRDHTGAGRANLLMGNGTSGSGASKGNLLAAGHPFDALVGQAVISGNSGSDTGTSIQGNLVFDNGILDATSIIIGRSTSSRAAHATGLLAVGGSTNLATLIVNGPSGPGTGSFLISDSTTAAASTGTLSVSNNGVAQIYTSILKVRAATNTATVNVIGGTLNMENENNTIGTQAAPIDNLTIDAANLVFYEDGSSLNASVINFLMAETNVFTIKSLPIISALPTIIPIIRYVSGGTMDGNASNLVLNPLPGSYTGYLSNDNAGTISLVITNGTVTSKPVTWIGGTTNAWDTTSPVWKNGANLTTYQEGDFVTFDDSGSTNLIDIVGIHTPANPVTVNNSAVNYTFTGAGAIQGPNGLIKQGAGSLTLSESGGDKFPRGIFVHGGTLVLDNANSAITGGLTNDAGTVVQIGNNDDNGALPGGNIEIDGSLVFNHASDRTISAVINGSGSLTQNGSNVLTLTSFSFYSGPTFVKSGTLSLSGAGGIASPLVAVQNGTLDLSAAAQGTFLSAVSLTNGTLNIGSGANFPSLGSLSMSNAVINLLANYNNVNGSPIFSGGTLTTGGSTNILNVTSIQNLPLSPGLPFRIPLMSYSSANFTSGFNIGWTNLTGISGYITNNAANFTIDLVITNAPSNLTWNGGSATDSNWSDAANWTGVPIAPLDQLVFDGLLRTNNVNDTPAGTTYSGMTFNNSAAPFTISGNPVNITGTIVNNSSDVQTINLGFVVDNGFTLDGGTAGGSLAVNGGFTNITAGNQTVTLLNTGSIADLWATNSATNGGGQITMQLGSAGGNWTILDGTGTNGQVQVGNLQLRLDADPAGSTLNFGSSNSAPNIDAGFPSNGVVNITGSDDTFNMNNGTLLANAIAIGNSGTVNGTFNLNGGTIILGPGSFTAAGGNGATIFTGSITNGSLYATNGGRVILAQRAPGTMTISGGLLDCGALALTTGTAATGNGTMTLSGGRLICTNVSVGSSAGNGSGNLNFNGGILQADADTTAFFDQENLVPLTNNVQLGGAIIDTAGHDVTFNWPLITDPALAGSPDGGLTKLGAGTLTLSFPNTYNGNTAVGQGTLLIDAVQSPSLVIVSNSATLGGNGVIQSNVIVNAGGTLAPGDDAVGGLIVAGDVTLNGTTTMEIDKADSINDMLIATNVTPSTITYGGTLSLPTVAGAITGGETFKLFSASNYVGSFSAITPTTPGPGMTWDTTRLNVDGTVSVSGTATGPTTNATITSVTLSGTNLIIHGTNNNVPNTSFEYVVLASTNVALPLTNWTPVLTNSFNKDGTFDYTNPVVPGTPHQFIDIKAVP